MKYLTSKSRFTISGILSAIVGCVSGCLTLYVGFKENAQGEFYDQISGKIDIIYCLQMFLMPFGFFCLISFTLIFLMLGAVSRKKI